MNNILQVSGNYALSISGEVWKMSKDNIPTKVMGYKDDNGNELSILKIAHGTNHLLALDTNGNVWALGANEHGQLGTNSRTASTVPVKVYKGDKIREIHIWRELLIFQQVNSFQPRLM